MKELVRIVTDVPNIFSKHKSYKTPSYKEQDKDKCGGEKKRISNRTSKIKSIMKSFRCDNLKRKEVEDDLHVTFDLSGIQFQL